MTNKYKKVMIAHVWASLSKKLHYVNKHNTIEQRIATFYMIHETGRTS